MSENIMDANHFKIDVPVKEVMRYNPATIGAEATVPKAAAKMCQKGVGSCIVLQNNVPKGIVTEEDINCKVVAKDRKPGDVYVSEIMSTPLITIDVDKTVGDATHMMVKNKVRRLPVVDKSKVVGIVTVRDIISVSNEINEIMSDLIKVNNDFEGSVNGSATSGVCDDCNLMSDDLVFVDGRMLCSVCRKSDDTD
ncbi:CBS domain-containing protein [Methanoplanus limicola]|uniref:Putative signal transduction protein with CBS domains n=1 Tax=Methanoplanus limicola DSM 2279 TaxID=937775 RepID=H1YWA7_9EURY|nr:putative signal transduction protein with CBS domains [Methanoplanus limicola DSM 2279]